MSSTRTLDGQTALVTGASRGIGRAVALALGEAGAEVVVNYASSPEAAETVVSAIQDAGGRAYALQANVSDEDAVDGLIKTVLERSGRIDVLVNNAGITRDGPLMRMKTDDWQAVINLNLSGVFLCTRAVTRPMLKQRSGRIIRSTAKEMASRGITVNAVAPGFIATDMTKDLEAEGILSAIPLGRFGTPDQVAGTVRFLAADPAAAYITGQVLQVDGGMVMS